VNPGTYELQASYIGYNRLREKVTVNTGETVTKNLALTETLIGVGEVVVTGTRRTDRTVVESPVPIDVLTATEIRQTGLTETSQLIQMVVPSFNFPRPTVADGSDHIRPATLRGLGPDQVLVLVNGKRRHNTALVHVNGTIGRGSTSVDLNAIPATAIERIEVLRDGAAAQYGSDAISAVQMMIAPCARCTPTAFCPRSIRRSMMARSRPASKARSPAGCGIWVQFTGVIPSVSTSRTATTSRWDPQVRWRFMPARSSFNKTPRRWIFPGNSISA
jgi:hypothetical protein